MSQLEIDSAKFRSLLVLVLGENGKLEWRVGLERNYICHGAGNWRPGSTARTRLPNLRIRARLTRKSIMLFQFRLTWGPTMALQQRPTTPGPRQLLHAQAFLFYHPAA